MRKLVDRLLDRSPFGINERIYATGDYPLLLACHHGKLEIAKALLRRGANPKQQHAKTGATALHWLVAFEPHAKEEIASLLLENGADFDAVAEMGPVAFTRNVFEMQLGGSPLHWAVAGDDVAALKILIYSGADMGVRFKETGVGIGLNVLEFACSLSRSTCLACLLELEVGKTLATKFRDLDNGGQRVTVNSLFWVLQIKQRWTRLLESGPEFQRNSQETMRLLIENGATPDCVLKVNAGRISEARMSAVFAAAYHQCNAELLGAGLGLGFAQGIDSTFGMASSGGTALHLAITHRDRAMFAMLLANGANIHARDLYTTTPLFRVAKETDDVFYAEKLLEAGAKVDPDNDEDIAPYEAAIHAGHFKVAKCLFDNGANRDRMRKRGMVEVTALGAMLEMNTTNAAKAVAFILSLPDRASDGFTVKRYGEHRTSAFHAACTPMSEDPHDFNISNIIISQLLSKYKERRHLDNTDGPHKSTVIGMAAEVGNYKLVGLLLDKGADPNIADEYGRKPLDLLYWRYCYPSLTPLLGDLSDADIEDKLLVLKNLKFVNRNTSEVLSILKSYGAEANVFRFPQWHQADSNYRKVDWVVQRLKENRSEERRRIPTDGTPSWGGVPIRVPEHSMQFSAHKDQTGQQIQSTAGADGDSRAKSTAE